MTIDYVKEADGSLRESTDLLVQRLRRALEPFGNTLDGVPVTDCDAIYQQLTAYRFVHVIYSDARQLVAHLRYVVVRWARGRILQNKDVKAWTMTTPNLIVDSLFGAVRSDVPAPDSLSTSDLLVIRALDLPRSAVGQEAITGLLRQRMEAGKLTVFCSPGLLEIKSREDARNDPNLLAMIDGAAAVTLAPDQFKSELKKPNPRKK